VPATDPKFVYPSCVFLLLILVELARGLAPGRVGWAVVGGATVVALAGNLVALVHGADRLRAVEGRTAAELGVLELARGHVAPAFQPDPTEVPQVEAGPYFAAVDALGSPADMPSRLASRPADVRANADAVLVSALRLRLVHASAHGGSPPHVEATSRGAIARDRGCLRFRPLRAGAYVDLTVPARGLGLEHAGAPVQVRVRRFGDGFPYATVGTLRPGESAVLAPPRDAAPQPWHARISTAGAVTAC
jgi:hypothetical protein